MQMKGVMIRRQINKRKGHFEIELVENEREEVKYTYFFNSYIFLCKELRTRKCVRACKCVFECWRGFFGRECS